MKAKKKFDPKVIQQFIIDHTEKFVIGLVGLLFLYFTYNSVTQLPPYDQKPGKLESGHQRGLCQAPKGPRYAEPAHVSTLRRLDRPVQDAR